MFTRFIGGHHGPTHHRAERPHHGGGLFEERGRGAGGGRGARMFERYGFRLIDEREVTKYRDIYPGKIYLFTILKDLTLNPKLYGADLHEKAD